MITRHQIDRCLQVIERFELAAKKAKDSLCEEGLAVNQASIGGNRHTGALRRASLDLSRELADLRNRNTT